MTHCMYACKVASVVFNFCDPVDCSLPGFSVLGILQARILKWVVISSVGNMLSQISYAYYSKLIPILKLDYYLHLS